MDIVHQLTYTSCVSTSNKIIAIKLFNSYKLILILFLAFEN